MVNIQFSAFGLSFELTLLSIIVGIIVFVAGFLYLGAARSDEDNFIQNFYLDKKYGKRKRRNHAYTGLSKPVSMLIAFALSILLTLLVVLCISLI